MLYGRPDVTNALYLCERKNKFLFEARPDLFPGGKLGAVECELWDMFYSDLNEKRQAS